MDDGNPLLKDSPEPAGARVFGSPKLGGDAIIAEDWNTFLAFRNKTTVGEVSRSEETNSAFAAALPLLYKILGLGGRV